MFYLKHHRGTIAGYCRTRSGVVCSNSQSSVIRYLERASAKDRSWPLAEDWDDRGLNQLPFSAAPTAPSPASRAPLDFREIYRQLRQQAPNGIQAELDKTAE